MCGLAGFLTSQRFEGAEYVAVKMAERIAHRGPDDDGVWADANSGIALAFRRLAVVVCPPLVISR